MRVFSTCLPSFGWETGLFLNWENLHWTKWFGYGNENSLALHSIHIRETSKEREQNKSFCSFRIFSVETVIIILTCTFFWTFYFCVWMNRGSHFFPLFPAKVITNSHNPTPLMVFTYFHLTWASRDLITIFPQYQKDLNYQKPIFPPSLSLSLDSNPYILPFLCRRMQSQVVNQISKPASLTKPKVIWSPPDEYKYLYILIKVIQHPMHSYTNALKPVTVPSYCYKKNIYTTFPESPTTGARQSASLRT